MLAHDSALKTITVNKSELIEKLLDNQSKHTAEYAEALEAYWNALQAELASLYEQAKEKEGLRYVIEVQPPENHAKDYSDAMQLLDWEVGNEVVISIADFKRFVQDEWDWQYHFKGTLRELKSYNSR